MDIELDGGFEAIIRCEKDAFDPLVAKTLGGVGLLTAARQVLEGAPEEEVLRGSTFGQEKHQLLSLAEGTLVPPEESMELRQMMFKDWDIRYQASAIPVSVPNDINGLEGVSVAVWGSNTIVAGLTPYGELGRRRLLEMTLSSCQLVSAMMCVREVRADALRRLELIDAPLRSGELFQDATELDQRRIVVRETAAMLASLELDLSLGAEMYMGPALVWGGRPLESYQQALRFEMGFDSSLNSTLDITARLSTLVRSIREAFEAELMLANADRQAQLLTATTKLLSRTDEARTAAIVGSVVIATLTVVGLFSSMAAIPGPSVKGWLSPVLRNAAVSVLSVIIAAAYGLCLRRAMVIRLRSAVQIASWSARLLFVAALVCLATSAALDVSDRLRVGFVTFGIASFAAAVLLLALRGDYGESSDE